MAKLTIRGGKHGVEYRAVPGWPGYAVGDDGSLWSRKQRTTWRHLSPPISLDGYYRTEIWRWPEKRHFSVHALVMLAFVGECPAGMEIRHLDGDKLNNSRRNLCYGTRLENMADSIAHGAVPSGEGHHWHKITAETVIEIRRLHAIGVRNRDIERKFGMGSPWVSLIVNRKIWKRV